MPDKKLEIPANPLLAQPNSTAKRVAALAERGRLAVTEKLWYPHDGKTYCNFGFDFIASMFGAKETHDAKKVPYDANTIIRNVDSSDNWKKVPGTEAWDWAMQGNLALACYQEVPHGHVAALAPAPKTWSQKWSAYVPQVYNVGSAEYMNLKAPFWVGENFAFKNMPVHYVYLPQP